jgi:hypothetical protein
MFEARNVHSLSSGLFQRCATPESNPPQLQAQDPLSFQSAVPSAVSAMASSDAQLFQELASSTTPAQTITVADDCMAEWTADIMKLKPGKREKWHTFTKDSRGCRRRVHYSSAPIMVGNVACHFFERADGKQAGTRCIEQGSNIPVMSVSVRAVLAQGGAAICRYDAATLRFEDGPSSSAELRDGVLMQQAESHTGHHEGRINHRVRVSTAPGEPVRG